MKELDARRATAHPKDVYKTCESKQTLTTTTTAIKTSLTTFTSFARKQMPKIFQRKRGKSRKQLWRIYSIYNGVHRAKMHTVH